VHPSLSRAAAAGCRRVAAPERQRRITDRGRASGSQPGRCARPIHQPERPASKCFGQRDPRELYQIAPSLGITPDEHDRLEKAGPGESLFVTAGRTTRDRRRPGRPVLFSIAMMIKLWSEAREWLATLLSDSARPELVEELKAILADFHPAGQHTLLESGFVEYDVRNLLLRIRVPTLLPPHAQTDPG
jgi:hypothetical protein